VLLAMDIGNTNIVLGGFEEEKLRFVSRLSTDCTATEDEYAIRILNALALHGVNCTSVSDVIVASVVPPINLAIKRAVERAFRVSPLFVEPGVKTGLGIRCDTPSSVGADLICACVAASALYEKPMLVIDIGTATKMMLVNDDGAFVGVSIMPGLSMGASALAQGTAQLPNVALGQPNRIIAKNTVDCMRSGVIFGHASMIDGMIDRACEEYGKQLPVCVTGGLAKLITPHCKHEMLSDEHLVLKGLRIIHQRNR